MTIQAILITAIRIFFNILEFAILIRCILSWLPINRNNFFYNIIYSLTEPIMAPIRRILDRSPLGGGMMIDFSPVIAYFLIAVVQTVLISIIYAIF